MGAAHPLIDSPVILFDGVCNLCNGAVATIIRFDTKAVFKFAPLQSDFARKQLDKIGSPSTSFDSIVLLKKEKAYFKSDAALEIARDLSGLWSVFVVFKILPRFLRDFFYDVVAKNRYSFFGKKAQCMIPTLELKARFLS